MVSAFLPCVFVKKSTSQDFLINIYLMWSNVRRKALTCRVEVFVMWSYVIKWKLLPVEWNYLWCYLMLEGKLLPVGWKYLWALGLKIIMLLLFWAMNTAGKLTSVTHRQRGWIAQLVCHLPSCRQPWFESQVIPMRAEEVTSW